MTSARSRQIHRKSPGVWAIYHAGSEPASSLSVSVKVGATPPYLKEYPFSGPLEIGCPDTNARRRVGIFNLYLSSTAVRLGNINPSGITKTALDILALASSVCVRPTQCLWLRPASMFALILALPSSETFRPSAFALPR